MRAVERIKRLTMKKVYRDCASQLFAAGYLKRGDQIDKAAAVIESTLAAHTVLRSAAAEDWERWCDDDGRCTRMNCGHLIAKHVRAGCTIVGCYCRAGSVTMHEAREVRAVLPASHSVLAGKESTLRKRRKR